MRPAVCCITKKETNDHRGQQLFIKFQYSYMFRHREFLNRLALEHFKRNIQISLNGNEIYIAACFDLTLSKHVAVLIF
jgi:hypothetical protein